MAANDVLEEQVQIWKTWWKAEDPPTVEEGYVTPRDYLPKLNPDEIRRAAASFKTRTTYVCGWHPRHIALLSPRALECLALLWQDAEELGNFGPDETTALIALIDKADGGLRPITLFRTLFRVFSRCRVDCVRKWASDHPDPQINMAASAA